MMRFLVLMLFSLLAHAQNVSLFLDEAPLSDLVKIAYGEIAKKPYLLTSAVLEAKQPVTVSLRDVSPAEIIRQVDGLLLASGFIAESRAGVVVISKAKEAQQQIVVYRPRYRSARYLADVVQPLTGAKSLLARALPVQQQYQNPPAANHQVQGMAQRQDQSPTSVAGMTDRGEVDQIAFAVDADKADNLRKLLKDLDTPTGEILLKAAVYEVGTRKNEGSAIQIVSALSGLQASIGHSVSGDVSIKINAGDLSALFTALDRDSRFKSISRPQVRVKNGSTARFTVGQDVPILSGTQLDRNGNPLQQVEYKPSGIILTAKPEIRADVIELDIQQELSNFVQTNTGVNNSPTLIKRSVSTHMAMQAGEVVILAGLQDERKEGLSRRLPLVGWLLSDTDDSESNEVLVFIEVVKIDQTPI